MILSTLNNQQALAFGQTAGFPSEVAVQAQVIEAQILVNSGRAGPLGFVDVATFFKLEDGSLSTFDRQVVEALTKSFDRDVTCRVDVLDKSITDSLIPDMNIPTTVVRVWC